MAWEYGKGRASENANSMHDEFLLFANLKTLFLQLEIASKNNDSFGKSSFQA